VESAGTRDNFEDRTMEHTDWLDRGTDAAEARFLMIAAITHHRFNSALWDAPAVRRLEAELAELDDMAEQIVAELQSD
jgi:hypothetical protein